MNNRSSHLIRSPGPTLRTISLLLTFFLAIPPRFLFLAAETSQVSGAGSHVRHGVRGNPTAAAVQVNINPTAMLSQTAQALQALQTMQNTARTAVNGNTSGTTSSTISQPSSGTLAQTAQALQAMQQLQSSARTAAQN